MADETKEGTEDQGTQENEADENQVQAAKFTYEQAIADPEIKREIDKVRDQAVTQGIQTFQENQAKKALDAQEEAKKKKATDDMPEWAKSLQEDIQGLKSEKEKASLKDKIKAAGLEEFAEFIASEDQIETFKAKLPAIAKAANKVDDLNPQSTSPKTVRISPEEQAIARDRGLSDAEYVLWRDDPEEAIKQLQKTKEKS